MTLVELRASHPLRFYEHQRVAAWWDHHAFAHRDDPKLATMPSVVMPCDPDPIERDEQASANQLADLYIRHPDAANIWRHRVVTCDVDDENQMVYLIDSGRGLEVHRDLRRDRFGVAVWL